MHPALSVIVFTSASGAGYGLLALLGIFAAAGRLPPDRWLGLVGLGLALGLVSGGLLASTAHLGRPERAWRAFSQWRSSWLSREGVASLLTYVPAGLFGLGWVVFGRIDGWVAATGLVAALCAAATIATTAMIYASLKPVAQWHSPFTLPVYLLFAAMTGAMLLAALLHVFAVPAGSAGILALAATALAWIARTAAWRHNDRLSPVTTAASATGLGEGTVRSVEWPHTEENYLLKEMGYRVARKHAVRLRRVAHVLAFALPLLLTLAALLASGWYAAAAAVAAVVVQAPGVLIERWLFFAEARHTVTLYYGR